MATSRLYYDDCYTSLFKAEVLEVTHSAEQGWRAYLDSTFFYPTSGGQPYDLGTLGGVPVREVVEDGDRIAHRLSSEAETSPLVLGSVEGCLDWSRRYDHMQQHTGQHLLSAVLAELFGIQTLSFHMGEDVSTIEIETDKLEPAQIDQVERRANDLIGEARPVAIAYEDASSAGGLRKLSSRSGVLRIVTITGYDRSACGGTHVQSTAEIGVIHIRNLDKVRGHVRLEFVCGRRATRHARQDFALLARLSRAFSVKPADLEDTLQAFRQRLEAGDKALAQAELQLAQMEGQRWYENTSSGQDGIRRATLTVPSLTGQVRSTALAFGARSQAIVAILPETLPGTVLLACSTDSGLHAGDLFKRALTGGGGRGGGSATLAQGTITDPKALEALLDAAGLSNLGTNERSGD